jgi:hypothetical protein
MPSPVRLGVRWTWALVWGLAQVRKGADGQTHKDGPDIYVVVSNSEKSTKFKTQTSPRYSKPSVLKMWGQLQISREAFQQILVCQHVFTPFLHVVNEFGSKIRHEFPRCNTSYACSYVHTHSTSGTEVASRPRHDYGKIITSSSDYN